MAPCYRSPVMSPRTNAVLLVATTGLAGCGSYLHESRPATLSETAIQIVERADDDGLPPLIESGAIVETYRTLVDPRVAPLVDEAVRANPDVVIAVASIEESRALSAQSRAARMPTISGAVNGSLSHGITPGIGTVDARSITFSIPMSYEVDLVGRYAREHRATERDALAEEADARAAAMSVAAEVADAYLDLVAARAEHALLLEQKAANERMLGLVTSRVTAGLASSVERLQQEQIALGVETRLATIDDVEAQSSLRLALLLGRPPGTRFEDAPSAFDLPTASDRTSISADDLASRPDVFAALLRLEAADDRAAAAVRAEMPQLRLTATPGYTILHSESTTRQGTVSGFTWSVGGALTIPIFDGLRTTSIVRQRHAEIDRRLAELDRALRLAVVEASAALASENQARRTLAAVQAQYALAVSLREDVEQNYVAGRVPYVNVLLAIVEEQSAARTILQAERAVLAARVTWVRAIAP